MSAYRPNVAAILQREEDGKILVAERLDFPDSWQFPQGGLDEGEDLIGAVRREIREELGIGPERYEIEACRSGYRYQFPKEVPLRDKWKGQEQTFFLCRYRGEDLHIDLETHHPEFRAFQWIEPGQFKLSWAPKFKRKVFRKVLRDFFGVEV